MLRYALAAAILAAPLAALPAAAAPAVTASMPVIAATADSQTLRIRLPDNSVGDTRATAYRTITVEGFDANGRSLGVVSASVHKRLTYASLALTPELEGAARLTVAGE
jgi:hypothetical protein